MEILVGVSVSNLAETNHEDKESRGLAVVSVN
jgi:hypothetical protein